MQAQKHGDDIIDAMKKISIVTATYNRGYCIGKAIKSVLEQTHTNFEYWIADDASTDNTREVVESFGDPRLKYVRYDANETHAVQYPRTLKRCDGDYIMRLDSDDYLISNKVFETMVKNLDVSGDQEWIHSYSWIDEKTGKNVNYFTGWVDGKTEMTFDDFLMGTKGYSDMIWIAKRKFIENFHTYYKRPCHWFTGLWEALQPDGKLVIHQEPMGVAGWGGTDNVSVFSSGKRLWDMCSDYNKYLASQYFSTLVKSPKRLGYFYQWAAYYDLLLGRKGETFKYILKTFRHDPANLRAWAMLPLAPLPLGVTHWILQLRSKLKWTYRTKGDWRA